MSLTLELWHTGLFFVGIVKKILIWFPAQYGVSKPIVDSSRSSQVCHKTSNYLYVSLLTVINRFILPLN